MRCVFFFCVFFFLHGGVLDPLPFPFVWALERSFHGGLFVFDMLMPQNFPSEPPKVLYRSLESERLNPNLYVDGTVCC